MGYLTYNIFFLNWPFTKSWYFIDAAENVKLCYQNRYGMICMLSSFKIISYVLFSLTVYWFISAYLLQSNIYPQHSACLSLLPTPFLPSFRLILNNRGDHAICLCGSIFFQYEHWGSGGVPKRSKISLLIWCSII